jgi:hypothetical protein
MAIEITPTGATIITGEHIAVYRMLALRSMMRLEVKTGMKATSRGNPFKAVREEFGITARKKELVLAQFEDILRSHGII